MSILRPNSEISLEYRFAPWRGLPLVDYVFSCDVEYQILIDQETESKRLPIEYKNKFMNVTINIYDSNPMGYIDFQLFFMTISIFIFWAFIGILFYEFWWIPNQEAQGKQPLPTKDFVFMVYKQYVLNYFYIVREKITKQANPMNKLGGNGNSGGKGGDGSVNNSGATTPKRQTDSWLSGTSASGKKKKKGGKKNK